MNKEEFNCILNATEGQLDIIIYNQDNILLAEQWHAPTSGAEILTPALQSACKIYDIDISNIKHYACVHGPGSFTGIRIIMSTVGAIRRVTGARNCSIDYMQALATTAQNSLQDILQFNLYTQEETLNQGLYESLICVITHARRNLVHCEYFKINFNGLPTSKAKVFLCSPQELVLEWQKLVEDMKGLQEKTLQDAPDRQQKHNTHSKIYVIGSGLKRNQKNIDEYLSKNPEIRNKLHYLPQVHPTTQSLWALAKEANYHHNDLEPLYIRPCDAVDNLSHIAKKQGMDADKAHARLKELLQIPVSKSILD